MLTSARSNGSGYRQFRDVSPLCNGSSLKSPLYNRCVPGARSVLRVHRNEKVSMFEQEGVRIDVLRRLAEQAMTDLEFRAIARDDLNAALLQFGYDLNPNEMNLVLKFRAVLEEAGLDLFLTGALKDHEDDLISLAGLISPKP